MKKILLVLLIVLFSNNIYSKNIAILVSGNPPYWNTSQIYWGLSDAGNWNDIFLMYEYLIKVGYTHDNIYVFFNDGSDWNFPRHTLWRYKISETHAGVLGDDNWGITQITDNSIAWSSDNPPADNSLNKKINEIKSGLTDEDNVLIVWREHGYGSDPDLDEYSTTLQIYHDNNQNELFEDVECSIDLEHENVRIYKSQLIDLFKFEDTYGNKKYNKRKMIISTCHSGKLVLGNVNFLNDKSTIITSADAPSSSSGISKRESNSGSYTPYSPDPPYYSDPLGYLRDHDYSSLFVNLCTLNDAEPFGNEGIWNGPIGDVFNYGCDRNYIWDDHVVSMGELHKEFINNSISEDWHPLLGDECIRADYIYIDEDLELYDANLSLRTYEQEQEIFRGYWVDQIVARDGLVIPNGSKVLFAVDKIFDLKSGFKSENGAYFHAYFGEIPCQDDPFFKHPEFENHPKTDNVKIAYSFMIYPNPANNYLKIEYNVIEEEKIFIAIYDLLGNLINIVKNIENHTIGSFKTEYDISSIQSGTYFVRFITPMHVENKQIIVIK